jgi:hypothetical protein
LPRLVTERGPAPGDEARWLQQSIGNQATGRLLQNSAAAARAIQADEARWLQRSIGNQATLRLPSNSAGPARTIQADGALESVLARHGASATKVGPPDGARERAADHAADAPPAALDQARLHSDGEAARAARSLDARAFTIGRDIYFGEGEYDLSLESGRRLLAHELAHVAQERTRPTGEIYCQRRAPPATTTTPPTTGAATPAAVYTAAVADVTAHDRGIGALLAAAPLGSGPHLVRTVVETLSGGTFTYRFNLSTQTSTAEAGSAQFQTPNTRLSRPSPTTVTVDGDMVMTVGVGTGALPSASVLARSLYHEGVHMMLYIDSLATANESRYAGSLRAYKAFARTTAPWSMLWAELDVYVSINTVGGPPPNTASYSEHMLDFIIEEKFTWDQEARQYGASPGSTNAAIAISYLLHAMRLSGVRGTAATADVRHMADETRQIFDAIDLRFAAPAATPSTTPHP